MNFSDFVHSFVICVYTMMIYVLLQSSAVQSGENIMHYGQSISDEASSEGQIPRILGAYTSQVVVDISK